MTLQFYRPVTRLLKARLEEAVCHIVYISGPRQVGKTTAIEQVLREFANDSYAFVPVDAPNQDDETAPWSLGSTANQGLVRLPSQNYLVTKDTSWLIQIWKNTRTKARQWLASPESITLADEGGLRETWQKPFTLVFDEIQKIADWSSVVKGLWDQDRAEGLAMHVVLLGSAPLLMQRGLSESLAGRFEMIRMTHWSYSEMRDCFGFTLDQYIYFGGYPGAATQLIRFGEARWFEFITQSLIEPNLQKDVMALARIDKPALLRQLFNLACAYSGQSVSMNKLRGELEGAGNTTTLSHYLELLRETGLIAGITKYSGQQIRQRNAPPKLNVLNTAFQSINSGRGFIQAKADSSLWGRLVESSVGAHLINSASSSIKIHYWRENNLEVDFVLQKADQLIAIEVKSAGIKPNARKGMREFSNRYPGPPLVKTILIGNGELELEDALLRPTDEWFD
jgi:uncharacterized protein